MTSVIRSSLLTRQVHVYMRPAPRSVGQSLLVLEELQKFGEIATFFNFQHDYRRNVRNQSRAVLAVFESADAAAKALEASPLFIRLPKSNLNEDESPSSSESGSEGDGKDRGVMTCNLNTSEHNHETTVRENPYHSAFHQTTHWFETQDLLREYDEKITSVPLAAFADCFVKRKGRMPRRHQWPIAMQNENRGDTALMGLYRKGKKARGET